jgi:GNAT superfamily N-acetyltransferase
VSRPDVNQATPADRERVVDTVVRAFANDPAFRHFFPDDASYAELAGAYAGYLFDKRVRRGAVWVVDRGASVSMWDPPSAGEPVEEPPLNLPAETVAQLYAYEAVLHSALPSAAHWYLGILATHPDHAGRRWGRAVMGAGLERAAIAGLPAYLETANPRNIEVYRRAGWDVERSLTVGTLQVWVMVHRG